MYSALMTLVPETRQMAGGLQNNLYLFGKRSGGTDSGPIQAELGQRAIPESSITTQTK
jgi:hypothetical protein